MGMTITPDSRLAELTGRREALEHTLAQQHVDDRFRLRMEALLESLNQQIREEQAARSLRRREWRLKGRIEYETSDPLRPVLVPLRLVRVRADR